MTILQLLKRSREIWGPRSFDPDKLHQQGRELDKVIAAMGVVFGDICRWERDRTPIADQPIDDLEKELGNIIFSTIRWCDDLGLNPIKCIERAIECQIKFQSRR